MKRVLSFFLALLIMLSSCITVFAGDSLGSQTTTVKLIATDDNVRTVTVEGILKYKDGSPVANTRIEIHSEPKYATTDENGYYKVENVEVGNHTFSILDSNDEPVVGCNLIVANDNGDDSVSISYQAQGVELNSDVSQLNIIEINALLPVYKVTVIDKYLDTDNSLIKSEKRCDDTYVKDSSYSYNALTVSGYDIIGQKSYKGTVSENTTLTFTYKKSEVPYIPPTKTIKVYDKFLNQDGTENHTDLRTTDTKVIGSSYIYNALNIKGYPVQGISSYTGILNDNDLEFIFTYKSDGTVDLTERYTLKVYDKIYDKNDNLVDSTLRTTDIKVINTSYNYSALSIEGYTVTSVANYTGIVTTDADFVFTYKEQSSNPEKYRITIYDKYLDASDNLERDEMRTSDFYLSGESYDYKALAVTGYTVQGTSEYKGVVDGNETFTFIYKKISSSNPDPVDPNPEYFTIRVYDKKYDANNNLESSILRLQETREKGYNYSYTANSYQGYSVTSALSYKGTLTKDLDLIFTYKSNEKPTIEDKKYTVRVYDNYYDENGILVNTSLRLVETKKKGSSYSYEALNLQGYIVTSNSNYSGTITKDIDINFSYQKPKTTNKLYTIKVVDEFYNKDGDKESYSERLIDTYEAGKPYSYKALDLDDYEVFGSVSYKGVADSDKVLVFTYKKVENKIETKTYKITVIDKYIYAVPSNHERDYTIKVVNRIRQIDEYTAGSSFKYNSICPETMTVQGFSEITGIADSDKTIIFTYINLDFPLDLDIEDIIPDEDETITPHFPEPKTGVEAFNYNYLIFVSVLLCILIFILYRKHK